MATSKLEERFAAAWLELTEGLPFEREFRFHSTRRWRLDFAWPDHRVGVEIHGCGFGHQTIGAITANCEKRRALAISGWRVLEFSSRCIGNREKLEHAVSDVFDLLSVAKEGGL